MVCPRCISAVDRIFSDANLKTLNIELGYALLSEEPSNTQLKSIQTSLESIGFSLVDDHHSQILNSIKSTIVEAISTQPMPKVKLSSMLTKVLPYEYGYLSRLFSDTEGKTIEQYFKLQKIEKVKELISYGQFSISEISFQLNYSSPAHLSAQFKGVTGMTPSVFRDSNSGNRKPLNML